MEGSTLYVPVMPCMDCARGIVQVGIKHVIIDLDAQRDWSEQKPKWEEHTKRTAQLFREANINLQVYLSTTKRLCEYDEFALKLSMKYQSPVK